MTDRKYVIETRRYIGKDRRHDEYYLAPYPLEGEFAGKKHYIPLYRKCGQRS